MIGAGAVLGREGELELLTTMLLAHEGAPVSGVVIEGPAGIGKTTVLRAAIASARSRGGRALLSQPGPDDRLLDFVGIADLLDEVELGNLPGIPLIQQRAIAAAIGRIEQRDADRPLICFALLGVLRALSSEAPLILAVDDVQWMDNASLTTLAFALRRLESASVRIVLSRRTPSDGTEDALLDLRGGLKRLALAPLSFGATGRLLHERLGATFSRRTLHRIFEVSGGNPLFALELGRALVDSGKSGDWNPHLPLPDSVERLLGARVRMLSPSVRRALVAVSLETGIELSALCAIVGEEAVDTALSAGVLVAAGARVLPEHPLLGEVARTAARPSELKGLRLALAERTHDIERSALHRSDAVPGEDEEAAAIVAEAARHASARGAAGFAAELGERVLRLTPTTSPVKLERRILAASYCHAAGMLNRATELCPRPDEVPPGPLRARLALVLHGSASASADVAGARLRAALEQALPGSTEHTQLLIALAYNLSVDTISDLHAAQEFATAGLGSAAAVGNPQLRDEALAALMWTQALLGAPVEAFARRAAPLDESGARIYARPERIVGVDLLWRGRVVEARATLESLLAKSDERGEGESYYALRVQLCELELRSGHFDRVAVLLDEWERERAEAAGHNAGLLRCQALLAAGRGDVTAAKRTATEALACAVTVGVRWHELEAARALGLAELLAGDPAAAAMVLADVDRRLTAGGVENPGAFPFAPDLIQALAARGDLTRASHLRQRLASRASEQNNPWAEAAATRGGGYVELAAGDDDTASRCFEDAAERFAQLGLVWDQGRALIGLGIAKRRLRRKLEAHAAFEQASSIFVDLGAPGWAQQARRESDRIGGRRSPDGGLTASELRVAELVAQGLKNKEVAAALVVTAGTVETHLTSVYRKLGVRTRTELARALAPATD